MMPPNAVMFGHCTVVGGEHLPAAIGGSGGLCTTIERAVAVRVPEANYTADITVLPRSRLKASIAVEGRQLPEQNFAVMDRELSQATIQRFAETLAGLVADAAHGRANHN